MSSQSVPPTPIRVGILGLSTKKSAWATLAHWPYLHSSPYYRVVAVCNSSLESSRQAIEFFKLDGGGQTTSPYAGDDYESFVKDANIDLVVVSTRADMHFDIALKAVEAGKDVFVEWPLGRNVSQAETMSAAAKKHGVRTMVGLQGRAAPSLLRVRELVASGSLGEIHSISYRGETNVWQDGSVSERYNYFTDRQVGGNLLTIYGGHILDALLFVMDAEFKEVHNMSGNFRKTMKIKNDDGSYQQKEIEKDTPDHMMLVGRLDRNPETMVNFFLRAGDRFPGCPGSTWRIYGTKAELKMEFKSAGPQIGRAESIQLANFETGKVEELIESVDEGGEFWEGLPEQGRNLGRLYERFARGEDYADWDIAVKRHALVDSFYDGMK